MRLIKTAPSVTTVEKGEVTAARLTDQRAYWDPRVRATKKLPPPTGSGGMSEAMRTIAWITGVAFGVAAPGAFAQTASDASATPTNPAFLKLDTNHDGFISKDEAKYDKAVGSAFVQADMNHDGRLDEDEFIKALSISQRETVEKMAGDGASAAKRYAVDSEITARVKAALLEAEGLRSLEISVQTYKGKVQLAGFADSKAQVTQAGTIAQREPGVKLVLNDLTVK
jgi:hypothetical protein